MRTVWVVFLAGCWAAAVGGCGGEGCEPDVERVCELGDVYWMDSCGNLGALIEACDCGCAADGRSCEACGCSGHYECGSNDICLYGDCVAAYGRRYEITVESVEVSLYDPDGEAWDWPGGMPDPFVCVYLNETDIVYGQTQAEMCTTAVQDAYSAAWFASFEADVYAADRFTFMVWDEDVADHDFVEGVYYEPIPVSAIKAGGMSWSGDYLEDISIGIEPVE